MEMVCCQNSWPWHSPPAQSGAPTSVSQRLWPLHFMLGRVFLMQRDRSKKAICYRWWICLPIPCSPRFVYQAFISVQEEITWTWIPTHGLNYIQLMITEKMAQKLVSTTQTHFCSCIGNPKLSPSYFELFCVFSIKYKRANGLKGLWLGSKILIQMHNPWKDFYG